MPYTDQIGREDVAIPQEHVSGLITATTQASAALALGQRVAMSSAVASQSVLSLLPDAYWVQDGGLKQTSKAAFEPLELTAAEIAVVIVVEEKHLQRSGLRPVARDHAGYRPGLREAPGCRHLQRYR